MRSIKLMINKFYWPVVDAMDVRMTNYFALFICWNLISSEPCKNTINKYISATVVSPTDGQVHESIM